MSKDSEGLQSLEQPLQSDWSHLVKDAIPDILVHILPLFAASRLGELTKHKDIRSRVVHANSCYEFLERVVNQEVSQQVNNCFVSHCQTWGQFHFCPFNFIPNPNVSIPIRLFANSFYNESVLRVPTWNTYCE